MRNRLFSLIVVRSKWCISTQVEIEKDVAILDKARKRQILEVYYIEDSMKNV